MLTVQREEKAKEHGFGYSVPLFTSCTGRVGFSNCRMKRGVPRSIFTLKLWIEWTDFPSLRNAQLLVMRQSRASLARKWKKRQWSCGSRWSQLRCKQCPNGQTLATSVLWIKRWWPPPSLSLKNSRWRTVAEEQALSLRKSLPNRSAAKLYHT